MSARQQFDGPLHMMEVQGGSFVKSLAHCYYMADAANKEKLYQAFAEYFHGYETRFDQWKWRQHEANVAAAAFSPATKEPT